MEDGELSRLWAEKGDREAFHELYRRHGGRVYAFALRVTGCPERAEEAVQDTFIKAAAKMGEFRNGGKFSTWLLTIAKNAAVDAARRHGRFVRLRAAVADSSRPEPETPDADAERTERIAAVRQAVRELPEDQRLAVALCNLRELPLGEVCATLGWKMEKLKSVLYRARQRLKRDLARHME